jgi:ribose/xylose/arabinose/galactoside ABC-type transport system permease subunit
MSDGPAAMQAPPGPGATDPVGAPDERTSARRIATRVVTANESWTLAALIILMIYFTAAAPGKFLTLSDMSLISQGAAPFLVMAVGQTFVIITAGIDL